MDKVIQVKADEVTRRAFKIYCATKGVSQKDAVADALAGKNFIPPEYFETARREIEAEGAAHAGA